MDSVRHMKSRVELHAPKNPEEIEQLREQIRASRPRTKDGVFWTEVVKTPRDYFDAAWHLPRLSLRFDFDSREGQAYRNALKEQSDLYVDRHHDLGPNKEFLEYVNDIENDVRATFPDANHRVDRGPEALTEWWLNFFDLYFDSSWYQPDHNVIISCVTVTGDEQEHYFLDKVTASQIPFMTAWLLPKPS